MPSASEIRLFSPCSQYASNSARTTAAACRQNILLIFARRGIIFTCVDYHLLDGIRLYFQPLDTGLMTKSRVNFTSLYYTMLIYHHFNIEVMLRGLLWRLRFLPILCRSAQLKFIARS